MHRMDGLTRRSVATLFGSLFVAASLLISLGVAIYPYAGEAYANLKDAVPTVRVEIEG